MFADDITSCYGAHVAELGAAGSKNLLRSLGLHNREPMDKFFKAACSNLIPRLALTESTIKSLLLLKFDYAAVY